MFFYKIAPTNHQIMKRKLSKWVKTQGAEYRSFSWQNGYGSFSISKSGYDDLRKYIQNQEEHHKRVPYKEEYRKLMDAYGVDYNEKYVWD
jgi:putative transposase